MSDAECVAFLEWAAPQLHLRWPGFRKVRRLPCKRIARRIRALGLGNLIDYRSFIEAHAAEWQVLDEALRIPISRFYRDRSVFEALGAAVLPSLARRTLERGASSIRCWSVGCASGEEVFTLSLVWRLIVLPTLSSHLGLFILGTDIDPILIERARRACYQPGTLKDLPRAWLGQGFDRTDDLWCVRPLFREGIDFAIEDVRHAMPEGPFDLILCRNLVFTYFDETLQRELGTRIARRLVDGGALVIGRHEAIPARLLEPWYSKARIYRKTG